MLKRIEAEQALEQARVHLQQLESELPRYQQDAAKTALEVSQLKSSKAERKILSRAMLEAAAASELLSQHEQDLRTAKREVTMAERHLFLCQRYEQIEAFAKLAEHGRRQWQDNALTINNLLELAERNAVLCGEGLKEILESRIMFGGLVKDLPRQDGATLIAELQKHHDLSPLLLHWPDTPATHLDGHLGDDREILKMPGLYKAQIWGLLAITAKRHGLPSLDQALEIPFYPARAQRTAATPQTPAPLPRRKVRTQPQAEEQGGSSDEELAELLNDLDTFEPSEDNGDLYGDDSDG
jgi:hypothetical protein